MRHSVRRPDQDKIEEFLIGELATHVGLDAKTIDPREPFARYGVDSLSAVRLAMELEEKFGCQLPSTALWDYPSIQSLAAFLASELEARTPERRQTAHGNGS